MAFCGFGHWFRNALVSKLAKRHYKQLCLLDNRSSTDSICGECPQAPGSFVFGGMALHELCHIGHMELRRKET